ncbi:MAG: single-stranded-DNA-specific exonuclease RecJ [Candidatus Woesebacteria bacterium]|nr:MAG: single-stranded-DNA-specific exonuclease RecJ [Candidatus Woesebacteria bacterium]
MTNQTKRWEVLNKNRVKGEKEIIGVLLKNRGIKTEKQKKEFFEPVDPMEIKIDELGISKLEISKAVKRIKQAKAKDEHVIVYGDYDADGITGTATMWETLHALGIFVLPHIPERFSEGYGLNLESVARLKKEDPKLKLIITVDHGITAGKKVDEVKNMGIDMIISDHHQQGKIKPKPLALIYTTQIGGSAVAWFFAREIVKRFKIDDSRFKIGERLQLAAIGTVADQLPLTGPSRSIVKHGLEELRNTRRPGLLSLFEEGRIERENVGTYEIGFLIAPRINSMGRLKHGLESLRLLCTKDKVKAKEIAGNIGRTNSDRQKIVDEVVLHAKKSFAEIEKQSVIILADESYHEGVIGLAAAKLVEEFYRPAIVLSIKEGVAKASARSISGFNIIESIRKFEDLYIEGGGHPMAAGFSIKTENIPEFSHRLNKLAKGMLTEELLQRRLKIDLELDFGKINPELVEWVKKFEPSGLGNPSPIFVSKNVEIISVKTVGRDSKHLKLKLKQNEHIFDSIFFGGGEIYSKLKTGADSNINIVYHLEENVWNGRSAIQLKIRDLRHAN